MASPAAEAPTTRTLIGSPARSRLRRCRRSARSPSRARSPGGRLADRQRTLVLGAHLQQQHAASCCRVRRGPRNGRSARNLLSAVDDLSASTARCSVSSTRVCRSDRVVHQLRAEPSQVRRVPERARWSVIGRTRQLTQSRTSGLSPILGHQLLRAAPRSDRVLAHDRPDQVGLGAEVVADGGVVALPGGLADLPVGHLEHARARRTSAPPWPGSAPGSRTRGSARCRCQCLAHQSSPLHRDVPPARRPASPSTGAARPPDGQLQRRQPAQQHLQHDLQFGAGQRLPEARVRRPRRTPGAGSGCGAGPSRPRRRTPYSSRFAEAMLHIARGPRGQDGPPATSTSSVEVPRHAETGVGVEAAAPPRPRSAPAIGSASNCLPARAGRREQHRHHLADHVRGGLVPGDQQAHAGGRRASMSDIPPPSASARAISSLSRSSPGSARLASTWPAMYVPNSACAASISSWRVAGHAEQRVRPVGEPVPVGVRDAEHVADHPDRQRETRGPP